MSKLIIPTRMILIIIGIAAACLLLAATTFGHITSAQLLSSFKQKGSNILASKNNMTGNGNMTGNNNTMSSILKKGSSIISGITSK
jgi:hypothetical protein